MNYCKYCGEPIYFSNEQFTRFLCCSEYYPHKDYFYQSDYCKKDLLEKELVSLKKENDILKRKLNTSLANNLCPDHRDKQAGKSCLACEIERLEKNVNDLFLVLWNTK